jgi:hypothetical protein
MKHIVLIAFAFIFIHSSSLVSAQKQPEGSNCREVPGKVCVCGEGRVCSCQTADELVDPEGLTMDGPMLKALLAVVQYRRGSQARSLKESEFKLENFSVGVSRRSSADMPYAYPVNFFVKSAPGEPGPSLTGTSLGHSYTYFVDKKTFQVVKHVRQE